MTLDPKEIHHRIRQILLNDWDPSEVARNKSAHGEYDAYIQPLRDLIRSGAGEDSVVKFLQEREHETMCFPGLDTGRLKPVARKLIRAVRDAVE